MKDIIDNYVHFQMAGILTIWELTLTTIQYHDHINKVKGQGCLKVLCCTVLCGSLNPISKVYYHKLKTDPDLIFKGNVTAPRSIIKSV